MASELNRRFAFETVGAAGAEEFERAVVGEGLAAGDVVAIDGLDRLGDGVPVSVLAPGAVAPIAAPAAAPSGR